MVYLLILYGAHINKYNYTFLTTEVVLLMLDNLDRLKSFYLVFSQGSVVEAAKMLHVTQSAVSQAILKLEEEIQKTLFVRQHKQLIPTAAGEQLFAVVQPFMMDLGKCLEALEHSNKTPFGELRIGAPTEFGKTYLPAIIAAYRKNYPEVTFHLKLDASDVLVREIGEGKVDYALVDQFLVVKQLAENPALYSVKPAVEERIILACSQEYYTNRMNEEVSLPVLTQQDYIEYASTTRSVNHWLKHHYNTGKTAFKTVLTVDDHGAVISAIKADTGLGVVASHAVEREIQSGEIVAISTGTADILNQISLVHLKNKIPTLAEKTFKELLMEQVQLVGF